MNHLHFRLRFFLAALVLVVISGTFAFMHTENLSLADAFYFNIVTIATVGYGDIHPVTQTGKMLTVTLILLGTGAFLGVVAYATEIMLSRHELQARHKKMHLIIGVYFSEVGTRLLAICAQADPSLAQLREHLTIKEHWTERDFKQADKGIRPHVFTVDVTKVDLTRLHDFLASQRQSLVSLLENPITLEQENFTEHLQAVFHLTEELSARTDLLNIPPPDHNHLNGDLNRAYNSLVRQWLPYAAYLRHNYPYLYSLSVRTNPFNPEASVNVQ
ncbi:MAG: potassium channel family protein [Desulfobulbaceae bacterium]|nr:potassium channel family protein [Desulfobulbaceae bacterium]HIJ89842.1 two pore domain potassium channel family protein [Deltaproteobacteria bacterium]